MKKSKGKKLKFLKGEKLMYLVIILLLVLIPTLKVYTSSEVTRTAIALDDVKKSINSQKEENESLSMQIDELGSLENIQTVAKELGLSYDNTSILSIE